MNSLQQIYISGSKSGLLNNVKPFLIPEDAFSTLENAYVWRDRVKKREGIKLVGRLRRVLIAQALGNTDGAGDFSGNIIAILGLEATSQIEVGSIEVTVGAQVFVETGSNGALTNGGSGTGSINYQTGDLTINTDPNLAATPVTITFNYFPSLPVMGIWQREIPSINNEQTIFWDTKYAYIDAGLGFEEFLPLTATTWSGTDADFFWATNYRGSDASIRLFFVTNFVNNAANAIRYTDGTTWTAFNPLISATDNLYQAKILIPYYGRLLALNTYEGTTAGGYAGSSNFFNRCRFSQIGSPVAVDAWRSDQFGKGGFIDAPVNEDIISATFYKNTLIVGFERSTWQLRYVGEYGLPFIWERISSDFGCESQYSALVFDQGVLQVGDRAITAATSINVDRIDLQIPDQVFDFVNINDGKQRIHGIRDFQKEVVYWNYVDGDLQSQPTGYKFPNRVLLYNYRNNTYAKFRENITCFGTFQLPQNITWDTNQVFWDDEDVFWDDIDEEEDFPAIVTGNQQGYIHFYTYSTIDDPSLTITGITFSNTPGIPTSITIPNHNIADNEWVQVQECLFTTLDPGINDQMYIVTVIDSDNLNLYTWNNGPIALNLNSATYIGNGKISLHPRLNAQTKDFNPYQLQGSQLKISYIDFLMDAYPQGIISVNLFVNSAPSVIGNLLVGNTQVESALQLFGYITNITQALNAVVTSPNHGLSTGDSITFNGVIGMTQINGLTGTVTYLTSNTFSVNIDSSAFTAYSSKGTWRSNSQGLYVLGSEYAWHRFFATSTGQFIRIQMTLDNDLMSNIVTHQTNWVLDAISLWVRPGSRNVL